MNRFHRSPSTSALSPKFFIGAQKDFAVSSGIQKDVLYYELPDPNQTYNRALLIAIYQFER